MAVHRRLLEAYGEPRWRRPLPPVAELVSTILSQNTNDLNRDRAFAALRAAFPAWEAVRDAPASAVIQAIRPAGLANQKGPRIQAALRQITSETGSLDLGFDPGAGADGTVLSIALQADGKVLVGGMFTHYNGFLCNHLVRLNDEAFLFQDRITGILDAHLSNVSNRLNQVMKVLTVMTTVFMPLTLLSGLWGMNVPLPHFPGGEAMQFWWLIGIMLVIALSMLGLFRRLRWI